MNETNFHNTMDNLVLILIKERKKAKLSQSEFAKLINTSQTTVSRMESFDKMPSLSTIIKAAEVLGLKLTLIKKCDT